MDVALDSNILLADPWLKSQRIRVLLDYLAKTRSNLLLLDAVEQEVSAHGRRNLSAAVQAVEIAVRNAERVGVSGLASIDATSTFEASYKAWQDTFRRTLNASVVKRISLEPSVLGEVVRRSAERIAPVRANGRETRDAIVWLSLQHYLKHQKWAAAVAFISANTEDFAGPDGISLRPELMPDLEGIKGSLVYYPSVDAFIKKHAEPISHITKQWIAERLDMGQVRSMIVRHLERNLSPERYFRIASSEFRDYYEPVSVESIGDASVELHDLYVWEMEPELIEVFLDFSAEIEADICCRLAHSPLLARGEERGYAHDEYRLHRTLACMAEVLVSIAAEIRGSELYLGEVEEVARC